MSYCVMLMPEAAGEGEEAGLIVFGMIIGVGSGSAPRSLTTTPLTSSRCAALSSSLTVGIALGSVGLGGSIFGSTVRTARSQGNCKRCPCYTTKDTDCDHQSISMYRKLSY